MKIVNEHFYWRVTFQALRQTLNKKRFLLSEEQTKGCVIFPLVSIVDEEEIEEFSRLWIQLYQEEGWREEELAVVLNSCELNDLDLQRIKRAAGRKPTEADAAEYILHRMIKLAFRSFYQLAQRA